MLRALVLLLVLLNALYFAWSHQMLRAYGFGPVEQREPQRVAQQVRPELIRILSADEVRGMEQPASAAARQAECLMAGPFDDARAKVVQGAAEAALPADSWSLSPVVTPARWIVYLGKFNDAQALARKRSELAGLNLRTEPVTNGPLAPGLSLGGFDSEARARSEMVALGKRGVRTATVVQEREESSRPWLRLPSVDDGLRARLEAFRPALGDAALRPCN
jgi:hypothetical protein